MTNKPMLSVELRAGLERLLENGYAQYLTKIDAVELQALLDAPDAQRQCYPVKRLTYSKGDRRYVNGWNDACSHWEEQPAPVAVVMPFAEEVIAKLRRFDECTSDGQDVDISREWFDTLTHLGLLIRCQRSPAYWEITKQGADALEVARLNGVKPPKDQKGE